ncbi:unnamed protein product, partial [Ixodes pacificus]
FLLFRKFIYNICSRRAVCLHATLHVTLFSSTLQLRWSEGKTIKCKKDFWAATETRRRRKTFSVIFLLAFSLSYHICSPPSSAKPRRNEHRCHCCCRRGVSSPSSGETEYNTKNRPPLPFPDLPPDICRHLPGVAPPDV